MGDNCQNLFELRNIKNFINSIDVFNEREVQNFLKEQCFSLEDFNLDILCNSLPMSNEIYIITGGIAVGKSTIACNFIRNYDLFSVPFISSNVLYNLKFANKEFSIRDYNRIRDMVNNQLYVCREGKISFVWETVLSKKEKIKYLESCKKFGYNIHCIFVMVENYNVAIHRAKTRNINNYRIKNSFIKDRYNKSIKSLLWLFENAIV